MVSYFMDPIVESYIIHSRQSLIEYIPINPQQPRHTRFYLYPEMSDILSNE